MSNELVEQNQLGALIAQAQAANPYTNENALATVTRVGDYLPYIQLMGSGSNEVKRGEFPVAHFALRTGKNIVDLGSEPVFVILGWRPKAMQYSPDVLSFYDINSDDFKKIQATADTPNSGKGYGPEFLVWLPEVKQFATYFLGNKTGRNEAANILAILKKGSEPGCVPACKQKAQVIDNGKHVWHGPKTLPYDIDDIVMPPMKDLAEQLTKFSTPPAQTQEVAEKVETVDNRR